MTDELKRWVGPIFVLLSGEAGGLNLRRNLGILIGLI
jgi:hypothetical protein